MKKLRSLLGRQSHSSGQRLSLPEIRQKTLRLSHSLPQTVPNETYTLGASCTLSINANVSQEHKDEAAKIIDMMFQPEFMQEMTTAWPGYWGTPLKDLTTIDTSKMGYLSQSFVDVVKIFQLLWIKEISDIMTMYFFPASTQQSMVNIRGCLVRYGTGIRISG